MPQLRRPTRRSGHPIACSAASIAPSTPITIGALTCPMCPIRNDRPSKSRTPIPKRDAHQLLADPCQLDRVDIAGADRGDRVRALDRLADVQRQPARRRPRLDGRPNRLGQHPVPLPAWIEALLGDHPQRLTDPEQMGDRWCAAVSQVVRPVLGAGRPVPVAGAQIGVLVSGEGPRARPHEAEPGRGHQSLLGRCQRQVDAPLVHLEPLAAHRRDAVDHQQRRMTGSVDRGPDRRDVVADRRRGVGVHGQHRLDLAIRVGSQPLLRAGPDRWPGPTHRSPTRPARR